ncbi:MAG TPA: glutamate racemase [Candidatus Onthousia faecavium]|nr:glutamate racemase [Candidatus Onthousia faecavium]
MIGLLDSGLGGVSVLREIIKVIPKGHFIYYSDSLNNPYGNKSEEEVYLLVKDIVNYFRERGVKAIVIACNTASAICVKRLREEYKDILFIAIEPAYKMVHDYNPLGKTLVMATVGTLKSEKFLALYHKYDNQKTILLPCESLAELIEEDKGEEIDRYLEEQLKNYKDVDNVVLGCTHYPLIKDKIKKVLGDVKFFDGAIGVSKELVRQLELRGLDYKNEKLQIEFIDSSGDNNKYARFKKYLELN